MDERMQVEITGRETSEEEGRVLLVVLGKSGKRERRWWVAGELRDAVDQKSDFCRHWDIVSITLWMLIPTITVKKLHVTLAPTTFRYRITHSFSISSCHHAPFTDSYTFYPSYAFAVIPLRVTEHPFAGSYTYCHQVTFPVFASALPRNEFFMDMPYMEGWLSFL